MSSTKGLTDNQQAVLGLLIFWLPTLITWTALGFPTDRASLGLVASNLLSGLLLFAKEKLGSKPPS